MLENLICDHIDCSETRYGIPPYWFMDAPLPWSAFFEHVNDLARDHWSWSDVLYRDFDGYIVGGHKCECFFISPKERARLYLQLPDWWKKYEQCRGLLNPTSSLLWYTSNIFFNDLWCGKILYPAVASGHSVMIVMSSEQPFNHCDEVTKSDFVGFNRWMCDSVFKRLLFLFPDAVFSFPL